MWNSKVLKPAPAPTLPGSRPAPAAMPSHNQPTRVLQSSRTPQQLSFQFRRG
jgi:hypothetical protein